MENAYIAHTIEMKGREGFNGKYIVLDNCLTNVQYVQVALSICNSEDLYYTMDMI